MNMTIKTTLALGVAGLSLLTLAGGASAQTTTGDPTLTTVFSTLQTTANPSYTTGAIAVGYDPNGGGGKLFSSPTVATAQSVYEPFKFTSSAAGTFSTLPTGSKTQLQVFASDQNINIGANFNIYASLYAYNPNAAAGTVPVTGPNLFGAQQKVPLAALNGGYFSSDFTLTGPVVAGQSYVLGITTLTGDTQDYAIGAYSTFIKSGLSGSATSGDFGFDKTKYITQNNDQGSPTVNAVTNTNSNVIAFRLDAAPPSTVPEASTSVGFALGLGLLGLGLVAAKRRRSVAH